MTNLNKHTNIAAATLILFVDPCKAGRLFRKALAANPKHRPALLGLGNACLLQNDFEGAIAILEKALAIYPQDFEIAKMLGGLYEHKRYYWRAISLYRNMLPVSTDNYFLEKHNALESHLKITKKTIQITARAKDLIAEVNNLLAPAAALAELAEA